MDEIRGARKLISVDVLLDTAKEISDDATKNFAATEALLIFIFPNRNRLLVHLG